MDRIILNALFRYTPMIINNCRCVFYSTTAFSFYFSSAVLPIFTQGVWGCPSCRLGRCFCFAEVSAGDPHPNKFLRLSALTIFGEKWGVYRQMLCLLSTLRSVASLNIFQRFIFKAVCFFENSEFYRFVKTQFSFTLLLSILLLLCSNVSINISDIQSELHGSYVCNHENIF